MTDPGSTRCPNCGGLNAADARWCGQCHERFGAPARPDSPDVNPESEVAAPEPRPAPLDSAPDRQRAGMFVTGAAGLEAWVCSACDHGNDIAASACASCGISYDQSRVLDREADGLAGFGGRGLGRGFMERISRGLRLVASSWRMLLADPGLATVPIAATLLLTPVAVVMFFVVRDLQATKELRVFGSLAQDSVFATNPWLAVAVALGCYYLMYLISIVSNAAVVASAIERLEGREPRAGHGIRLALKRLGPLAAWTLVTATVGVGLRMLEEAGRRGGFLARASVAMVQVAWGALSFFVVPVIVVENTGAIEGFKRSSRICKKRWGETLAGEFGLGIALSLAAIPVVFGVMWLANVNILVGYVVGVIAAAVFVVTSATLGGIFNAALYHYARTNEVPPAFWSGDLKRAVYAPRGPAHT